MPTKLNFWRAFLRNTFQYLVGVQHVQSWQEMSKVIADKGEIQQETLRLSQELGMSYSGPGNRIKVELTENKADVL